MQRAHYGVLQFIKESGVKVCKVVSSVKFVGGLMILSGDSVNYHVDTAMFRVLPREGVLGIKVKIMLPWNPSGKISPKKSLPDNMSIVEPKDEILPTSLIS